MNGVPSEDPELMQLALAATGVGLWSYDVEAGRATWDRRMHELTGCDAPLTPESYETFVHPEDRAMVRQTTRDTFSKGQFKSVPHRFVRPNGQVRWLQTFGRMHCATDGKLLRISGATLDITEQRQLEDRFTKSHRLETVGQLAAGIAHNFNNLLATMLPAIDLARTAAQGEPLEALTEAAHAGRRAAELVRQLSAWTRKDIERDHEVEPIDLLTERVVGMCRRFFEPHICISSSFNAGDAGVRGQVAELEQAVMNLLVNARDALRDAGTAQPRIEVFTDRVADETVRIRIVDNGPGISADLQARIFEPFFTTKPPGVGTGLGLSTVLATVQRAGGSVRCDGSPGRTTFEVFLPHAPLSASVTPVPSVPVRGGGAVVLVVDDDAPVLRAVARLLEGHGFQVRQAEDGARALQHLASEPSIGVVLLDQTMPSGHGADLVPQLRAARDGLFILFHSGHEVSPEHRRLVDDALVKPVAADALLRAVQRALERQRA